MSGGGEFFQLSMFKKKNCVHFSLFVLNLTLFIFFIHSIAQQISSSHHLSFVIYVHTFNNPQTHYTPVFYILTSMTHREKVRHMPCQKTVNIMREENDGGRMLTFRERGDIKSHREVRNQIKPKRIAGYGDQGHQGQGPAKSSALKTSLVGYG